MSATNILALDIGTSCAKAIVFNEIGGVREETQSDYSIDEMPDGFVEQHPDQWWSSTCKITRQLAGRHEIELVVLTGTMQNVIPLGEGGDPLHRAILYSDLRASSDFASFRESLKTTSVERMTGNQLNPQMSFAKIAWLQRNRPDVFRQIYKLHFGAKDYISFKLTGRHTTDVTCASTTGLMDIQRRKWSVNLIDRVAGLNANQLPEIKPASDIVGNITPSAARQSELNAGTPVVNGCGDVGAATLGAISRKQDLAYVYLGTSGWVAKSVSSNSPKRTAEIYRLAHPFDSLDIHVSPFLTGGSGARWFADLFGETKTISDLDRGASMVDKNPPGTLFLPYLYGERGPFNDPFVRGAFVGLDASVTPGMLYYAVLEGIAFAIRNNRDALGCSENEIRLIGGAGVSPLWPQLIADSLASTVRLGPLPASSTAFGALAIALQAMGFPAYEPRFDTTISPRIDRRARVLERWELFLRATDLARSIGSPSSSDRELDG